MTPADDASLVEKRGYRFRQVVGHLYDAGMSTRLFALIERPGFLAAQAAACGGFETTSEDLEVRALPTAIGVGDWDRFLHYALLALNLRGLAEAMARPAILEALARAGRFDLAEDALGRIPDPATRAAARAHLAAACSGGSGEKGGGFQALLARIDEDLEPWSVPSGVELPVAALATVARRLAPDLPSRWPVWLAHVKDDREATQSLAWAVAEGYLAQKQLFDDGLWQALAAADRRQVAEELPERLGALSCDDPGAILSRLAELLGPDGSWMASARLLARWAEESPDHALAAWEALTAPVPWSADLAEAGWSLFRRFPPERLEALAAVATYSETRAALRILALAAAPAPPRMAAALAAVEALENGPRRLHWALRYLESRPPGEDAVRQLGAVLAYLRELRYEADPMDVARFLDLAVHALPEKALTREIEDAVFSPASRPETLRLLCARVTALPVLSEILQRAERFAAAVAPTEAEGFLLRGELIQSTTRRLCLASRDLRFLDFALAKLLPDEEDELRAALAADFAGPAPELARQVSEPIRTAGRRLESELPASPAAEIDEILGDPARRYKILATVDAVEGERLALSALLETPFDPLALAERWLTPIRDREIQTRGLLRLAWHALAYEREFHHGRQDRVAVLEVVRASLAVTDDARLAALTPEIAALGAQRGGRYAVAEFQEAARRLFGLTNVDWPLRRAAFAELLSRLGPVFLPEGGDGRRACHRIAEVLRAALRLPDDLEPEAARNELCAHWDEVLPLIAGAAKLAPRVAERLASIATLPPGWKGTAARDTGQKTAVCLPDEDGDAGWLRQVAQRVGRDGVEPNDPAVQPLITRLWSCASAESRQPLAEAALLALRTGGRARGEAAVRLWLHAHLAPRPGIEQADHAALSAAAQLALERARKLPSAEDQAA
ncbi:MAG TPA: hypothetical protein VFE33_08630 [Thermoanaerobaculia bacterium]|nr:hypothetical protein [Thermoanaerobaculia bacterium]